MISADLTTAPIKLKHEGNSAYVHDPVRKKWLLLTPEEHVRQLFISYLHHDLHYPYTLMAVEKKIVAGTMPKRFDIVVYNRDHLPWMLIECKAPEIIINENTLHQLLQYHHALPCYYWVLTNGRQIFCADACDRSDIRWMNSLPAYNF